MTTTTATPAARTTTRRVGLARGAALGTAGSVLANAAVFALATRNDPLRVVTGWQPDGTDLALGAVLGTSIAFVLLAAAVLWGLERLRADGFRLWAILAGAVATLSIAPLFGLDVDNRSKLALAAMHLVVGGSAIGGQAIARHEVSGC
ncbi:MAG: hypothetical protein QOE63_598 [Acidimicrobiaceae bacterium]|jgi:hypothetical protein